MGRLFWKIFLWFWAAMLLMGLSIAWSIATLLDHSELDPKRSQYKRMLQGRVETLAQVMEYSGEDAALRFLRRTERRSMRIKGRDAHSRRPDPRRALGRLPDRRPPFERPHPPGGLRRSAADLQLFVVNQTGQDILQRPLPDWVEMTSLQPSQSATKLKGATQTAQIIEHSDFFSMTRSVIALDGQAYAIQGRLNVPARPRVDFQRIVPFGLGRIYERNPRLMQIRISLAILLSSLFCFGLSWYLVRPMKHLSSASKKIANGQLDTRVAKVIGARGDELETLGRDFDFMAERLQTLISRQQNLLNDVSHELRSPLARLQVAIGLAQQKSGSDITDELERIELETTRLNDLLGQVLTLSRLDSGIKEQRNDYVDLVALLEEIVADADFEAAAKQKRVLVSYSEQCSIQANMNLLHRALENVIRNAVKYSAEESTISIRLSKQKQDVNTVKITISDRGDGVPEDLLPRLFEPFFRVGSARDRTSGGYGLGLAIAKRAISAHQGSIKAANRVNGGLRVTILLPIA